MKDLIKEINKINRIDLLQWCYQRNIPIPRQVTSKTLKNWNVTKHVSKPLNGLFQMFNCMATQDDITTHVAFLLDVRPEFVSSAYNFERNRYHGQFWLGNSQIYTRKSMKNNRGEIFFVNMELVNNLLRDRYHAGWRSYYHLQKGTKANREEYEKTVTASQR